MNAYYNEHDAQKAAVLRELIAEGVIAPGDVDERSIKDVTAGDVRGYIQCHFFAGIGVWSYAARLAGWPDSRPMWTGSCPCPSFSAAGKGGGFDDPRHLWPDWARLIAECRPAAIFGEQADDAIGYGWLDLVQTDLEAADYAVGKAILGACSVGAPHMRQRCYFAGELEDAGHKRVRRSTGRGKENAGRSRGEAAGSGDVGHMEHSPSERRGETRTMPMRLDHADENGCGPGRRADREHERIDFDAAIVTCRMGSPIRAGSQGHAGDVDQGNEPGRNGSEPVGSVAEAGEPCDVGYASGAGSQAEWSARTFSRRDAHSAGPVGGFWADADWIPCRNPKVPGSIDWRPIKPGTFVVASRIAGRVLGLRAAGDAIVAQVAQAWISAYMEATA